MGEQITALSVLAWLPSWKKLSKVLKRFDFTPVFFTIC